MPYRLFLQVVPTIRNVLPADPGDNFGASVAVSSDTIVVGARNDGSAHVFVRSGSSWTRQQKLKPDDLRASDFFGWSVTVSGGTALVGAPRDDSNGMESGAAYVFDLLLQ